MSKLQEVLAKLNNKIVVEIKGKYYFQDTMSLERVLIPQNKINEAIAQEADFLKTKKDKLGSLIVTIANGKRFHADPESRTDLMTVVIEGQALGLPDETILEDGWKTPDGIIEVTLGDIREASSKALEEKAKIIGVIE